MTSPTPPSSLAPVAVRRFRFLPGRPLVAAAGGVTGAGLLASSLFSGGAMSVGLGATGLAFALLYFLSPAWRNQVVVDERGLEVLSGRGERRFQLAWSEIVRVVAAPASASAFVDGGAPERSLLLPGPGARAPYRIADQRMLYDHILAHVPADRVTEVDRLGRRPS